MRTFQTLFGADGTEYADLQMKHSASHQSKSSSKLRESEKGRLETAADYAEIDHTVKIKRPLRNL